VSGVVASRERERPEDRTPVAHAPGSPRRRPRNCSPPDRPTPPEGRPMPAPLAEAHLDEPITAHLRNDFTRLYDGQTVGQALDWLRKHPPAGRIIYFYVVDADGRLKGVVPTRRLVLSPPETPLADLMGRKVVTLPAAATVLDACEFFIQHR